MFERLGVRWGGGVGMWGVGTGGGRWGTGRARGAKGIIPYTHNLWSRTEFMDGVAAFKLQAKRVFEDFWRVSRTFGTSRKTLRTGWLISHLFISVADFNCGWLAGMI